MKYCKQQAAIWTVVMVVALIAGFVWADELKWDVAFWGALAISQMWVIAARIMRVLGA